ncbi:MAG: hypothetical protein WCX64_02665 [Candidatus Micrarchaeia archaeon]
MNKQKILQYITIFIIIAFVGEIFVLSFRSGDDTTATATPTPVVSSRAFSGNGTAAIKVTKLTSQFIAQCNTTDDTILDKVRNAAGVESATYETAGIVFSTLPALENDTAIVTSNVARILEDSCEGFELYRFAYVLPQGSVNLTGTQKTGNATVNDATVILTNYSLLSYAQLVSSPGVQAFLDYRYDSNSTPTAQFSVDTLNGIIRKASAMETISTPQASFSGNGMVMGTVNQIIPVLAVNCPTEGNYTEKNITAAFERLNTTFIEKDPNANSNLYYVEYNQTQTTANKTTQDIIAELTFCKTPARVFQVGYVWPQNGSTCANDVTYGYSDRTEFKGEGNAGEECRNITFTKLTSNGIFTLLDVNAYVNNTVQAYVSSTMINGRVVKAVAQEG